tara:strand:- start:4698 stop:5546 length:849 start_codon:yes stop_codon:yes gene_type:complete
MKEVRSFYEDTPFNFSDDIDFITKNVKDINQILEYKDLNRLLLKRFGLKREPLIKNVIEFGCGTGWLTNSLSYHYKKNVTSIDFTKKAVDTAKKVSKKLNLKNNFVNTDIFEYKDEKTYDLVISLGVLHHTYDCKKALKKISKFVKKGGFLYVGLYHLYGRLPMLRMLRSYARWYSEKSAFNLYQAMNKDNNDNIHSYSWFRDQILHPHETQHTLEEVNNWLKEISFELVSTSINNYKKFKNEDLNHMYLIERNLEGLSYENNVQNLKFSPGYFTLCASKIN